MQRSLRALSCLLLGCGAAASTPPVAAPAPVDTNALAARGTASAGMLAPGAAYAELVHTASELEGRSQAHDCLLSASAGGYALEATIVSAVRPLPAPAEDLDELVKRVDRVEILSSWGRYGDNTAKLALAGFTVSAPAREAVALFISDRGLAVRGPSGSQIAPKDGLDLSGALATLAPYASATVFIAAEAGVKLAELERVLTALSRQHPLLSLAVNLSPDTALPAPVGAAARVSRCEQGLPATDQAEGDLPVSELTAGIAALKERAPDCLARGDAAGAAGGRLRLAMRIDASGRVQDACLAGDELGDPGAAACVLEVARSLRFTPPAPSGVVDVELPLVLRPTGETVAPRAICTR